MARPSTITNAEILKAARELFLARGPTVTTAEIARAAGISEGSIFKRFPTKRQLFLTAIGVKNTDDWAHDLSSRVGQGEIKENLVNMAVKMMSFFKELMPRMMLLSSEGMTEHVKALRDPESPPRKGLEALAAYLEQEMDLGRLASGDPEVLARVFLGTIWDHIFIGGSNSDDEQYIQTLVDTLWRGIDPGSDAELAPGASRSEP